MVNRSQEINQMASHMKNLLLGMMRHPTTPVATLPLLQGAERNMILHDWNRTDADFPKNVCTHHLFMETANKHPDVTAVVAGNPTAPSPVETLRSLLLPEKYGLYDPELVQPPPQWKVLRVEEPNPRLSVIQGNNAIVVSLQHPHITFTQPLR